MIGLDQPLRHGQQLNYFLVFSIPKDLKVIPNLQPDKLEAFGMPADEKQFVHVIIARLLKEHSGKTIVAPASELKTTNGHSCVKAAYKAESGHLFPMKKSMLFVTKPVVWLRYDDIDRIEIVKGISRARSFDIVVHKTTTEEVEFKQIEGPDKDALIKFFRSVGVKLEGGEEEQSVAASTSGRSARAPRQAAAGAGGAAAAADDDDAEEEDDEDFEDGSSSEGGDDDDGGSLDSDDVAPPPKRPKKK